MINELTDIQLSITLLLTCHFIGDYPFQSVWMIINKGKDWEILFYHCASYTAPFALLALVPTMHITIAGLLTILISHMFIDALKARWNLVKTIWADQLLHLSVLAILLMIGWL